MEERKIFLKLCRTPPPWQCVIYGYSIRPLVVIGPSLNKFPNILLRW